MALDGKTEKQTGGRRKGVRLAGLVAAVWLLAGGECADKNQGVSQQGAGQPNANGETRGPSDKYHIVVARPSGRVHREAAEGLKIDIGRAKGVVLIDGKQVNAEIDPKKLIVVSDADQMQSTIYYGIYEGWEVIDAAGKKKLQFEPAAYSDLQLIKQLKIRDPNSGKLVPLCPDAFREKISDPDPPCDPAWLVQNAPAGAVYTLQIGFYHSSPQRKQTAVDAVKKLRADGIPAYLNHGVERSIVTVGEFGPEAVVDAGAGQRPKLSKEVQDFILRRGDAFKYNLDNGQIWYRGVTDPATGKTTRVPQLSFLVKIPRGGDQAK